MLKENGEYIIETRNSRQYFQDVRYKKNVSFFDELALEMFVKANELREKNDIPGISKALINQVILKNSSDSFIIATKSNKIEYEEIITDTIKVDGRVTEIEVRDGAIACVFLEEKDLKYEEIIFSGSEESKVLIKSVEESIDIRVVHYYLIEFNRFAYTMKEKTYKEYLGTNLWNIFNE